MPIFLEWLGCINGSVLSSMQYRHESSKRAPWLQHAEYCDTVESDTQIFVQIERPMFWSTSNH
jgi:hypothetical protein